MLSAHNPSQHSALAIARAHSTQPAHTKSPNSPRSAAHRAYICRKKTGPLALSSGATALRRGWAGGREDPLSRVWVCATPWSAVCIASVAVNGIAPCVMRVASAVVVTVVCSVTARPTRAVRGIWRWGWAGQRQLARELRSGGARARCQHPLARANFQTSFNLI